MECAIGLPLGLIFRITHPGPLIARNGGDHALGGTLRTMPIQFSVLASGSRGNSSLIHAGGAGLLIDLGLGPRALAGRLEAVGSSWDHIAAALLTHTHGDHVRDATLRWLSRRRLPLICHEGHRRSLSRHPGFRALEELGLVRHYDDRPFLAPMGLRVEPIRVSHDGGPTFGFRVEGKATHRKGSVALGYVADTGFWWDELADALTDVDVLGVEFNHDVEMQSRSGRSPSLIARNLGQGGHLSNEQGAGLISAVLARSAPGSIRHVVLLHLSQDCNCPDLATRVARQALRSHGSRATVHAAGQWSPHPEIALQPRRRRAVAVAVEEESRFPWEAA